MPRDLCSLLRFMAWGGITAGAGSALALAHEIHSTQAAGVSAAWLQGGLLACLVVMLCGVMVAIVAERRAQ